MGDTNHIAALATNVAGGRQGWDTTGIPVSTESGELTIGMSEFRVRFSTTGDSYLPAMVGFAVDAATVCPANIEEIFLDGFESISR